MRRDLPTPDQILEELADKAAAQIDRRAPVAFDDALAELIRYHRFLLAINASRTSNGTPFSFAEVPGDAFAGPHLEWTRQYVRLMERAVDRIGEDSSFVRKLAYAPNRLLPGDGDDEPSAAILQAILDLGPVLVHRLQAWVTKRTVLDSKPGEAPAPRLTLTPSDEKAYGDVVAGIVGAWESLVQSAPQRFRWGSAEAGRAQDRWSAFRCSWPFLWHHLGCTAYSLAVAVWNEDETTSALLRDALVRWPATFEYNLAETYEMERRGLIYPGLLNLEWTEASERIKLILPEYQQVPTPDQVFSNVLHGAHDDVMLITAALLLSWRMRDKQTADLGARTAASLLRRELTDPEDHDSLTARPTSFKSLVLDVLRLEMNGRYLPRGTYGATLDSLVQRLDLMSERRVVPGRSYAPSTLHEREGLRLPVLAILLANVPKCGDDGLEASIRFRATNEAALPDGDRSLRACLSCLKRYVDALTSPDPSLRSGVTAFSRNLDFETAAEALSAILNQAKSVIEVERL